jgi:hypothetical protein
VKEDIQAGTEHTTGNFDEEDVAGRGCEGSAKDNGSLVTKGESQVSS